MRQHPQLKEGVECGLLELQAIFSHSLTLTFQCNDNFAKPKFFIGPVVQLLNIAKTYVSGVSKAPVGFCESPDNDL